MDASRNFLRVLAEPKAPSSTEIDIVAVHGLNPFKNTSNALSTWTSTNGEVWLQDDGFLPTQIPNARIMLFGYNSNVAFTSSNAGLVQQATNLLVLLDSNRQDCPTRPIIFLCHSLGGILVKRALVHAFLVDSYAAIYRATFGLVFFGTPHGGGNNARVGSLAAGIARKLAGRSDNNFLEALKKNSYYGEQNRDDFLHRAKDFSYLTFFESNPTRKLKIFSSQVVDRQNAVLGLDDEREPKFAMDADHSNICKFNDPLGEDYYPVWTNVLEMSKQAVEKSKATESVTLTNRTRDLSLSDMGNTRKGETYYILPPLSVSCFVKRPALMKQLEEYSTRTPDLPCPVIVLLGMGGQGKSQLTMEFCRAGRADGKLQAIFWIDATSNNSLGRSLDSIIAKTCDSAPVFDSINAKVDFVKGAIETWDFSWLLVFDNYDRPDEVFRISSCFPQSSYGSIIVTSRHASSKRLGNTIQVTGMTEDESLDLLFSRSQLGRTEESLGEAKVVAAQLGYLPLAVDQAGAYINTHNLSISLFSTHYKERKAHILKFTPSLTEYRKRLNDSDSETALNVFTTLELSLDGIGQDMDTRKEIEDFLTISAFYSNLNIGEDLAKIAAINHQLSWRNLFTSDNSWDHYIYQDTVANLNHLSLLQNMSPGDIVYFSFHPLVADWLKLRRDMSFCRACTLLTSSVLENLIGPKDVPIIQLDRRQYILAHLDSFIHNQRLYLHSSDFTNEAVLRRLHLFGYFLTSSSRLQDAKDMYQQALQGYEKAFSINHSPKLSVAKSLGMLYMSLGMLKEAEEIFQRALQEAEMAFGTDHRWTLDLVCCIGVIHRRQGRLQEAEEMLLRALRGYEKDLGADHLSTLNTIYNLGVSYAQQKRLDEAEEMFQRALKGYEKVSRHDRDHISFLNSMSDLGVLYKAQDRLKEAEDMLQRALNEKERTYGVDHHSTLQTAKNLGNVFQKQGKLDEAKKMFQLARDGKVKGLRESHPLKCYDEVVEIQS